MLWLKDILIVIKWLRWFSAVFFTIAWECDWYFKVKFGGSLMLGPTALCDTSLFLLNCLNLSLFEFLCRSFDLWRHICCLLCRLEIFDLLLDWNRAKFRVQGSRCCFGAYGCWADIVFGVFSYTCRWDSCSCGFNTLVDIIFARPCCRFFLLFLLGWCSEACCSDSDFREGITFIQVIISWPRSRRSMTGFNRPLASQRMTLCVFTKLSFCYIAFLYFPLEVSFWWVT